MQVLVPETKSYRASAAILDHQILKRQRCEAMSVLNIIVGRTPLQSIRRQNWDRLKVVSLWRPWPGMLASYILACYDEWIERGNPVAKPETLTTEPVDGFPDWWGGPVHRQHRKLLYKRDREFYKQYRDLNGDSVQRH